MARVAQVQLGLTVQRSPIVCGDQSIQTRTPARILHALSEIETRHAPARLYLLGDESLLSSGVRVSIIGAQDASAEGLRRARALSGEFSLQGIIVVSDLAHGIDRAAHEAALTCRGRTIAVIGTPLDQAYPDVALQRRIALEHLVVSQFALGTPVARKNFPCVIERWPCSPMQP